jgi:anthranilate synthase component 1
MNAQALQPDFEGFAEHHAKGDAQLVMTTLVGDLETPVSAFIKLRSAFSGPSFLLESVEGGAVRGRYSMIGLRPDVIWRCQNGKASLNRSALQEATHFEAEKRPPLESLRALLKDSALPMRDDMPPMSAGLFGYLGYDMVREMEQLAKAKTDPLDLPDAIMIRPTAMVIFDAVKDTISVIVPARVQAHENARSAYEKCVDLIEQVTLALELPLPHQRRSDVSALAMINPVSNTSEADYQAMVARAKDYIRAGDIFQVVLSQRFEAKFDLPALALYRALRRVNPAPYLCYLDFEEFQVVCSSPEILVKLRDGKVTIRPIAGTRPRGATPAQDEALAQELLADEKERAEHLMLLDLGRNDVGRVSEIGTVDVTDSFFLERYSQVMHIVSNVEGRLHHAYDALQALAAGFPAGTVSGAPKIRAMQIIDELEKDKRGIYAGCIGYFGGDGDMDTCIVLRTAIVKDGVMRVQAGAGIVYDSVPENEQQECVNKAKALFRAAEEAVRFASHARRGQ